MAVGNRARHALRWLALRSPRTVLFGGWLVFVLGCYPGYLSTDSVLQLYTVRSGEYSDYSPVMTAVWGALEYVISGPFPMLALQSGLFLFGTYAILRKIVTPRAAAVIAACVLLFPPVFAPMAVIWPDPLMAGALLAAIGAILDGRRSLRIAGGVLGAIACACRPELIAACVPLVLLVVPRSTWWRRAAIALGITLGLAATARVADWALTETETYSWRQALMVMDVVGTLRRARVNNDTALDAALAGLPIADPNALRERMQASSDALNWWPLSNGDKRIFDLITTDARSAALGAAWRGAITDHPRAYFWHRWALARALLGMTGKITPIYDELGDFELLAPLHHRATVSDWQYNMQQFVRAVGQTPLFRPWLYFVLAFAAIILARRRRILRALAISGLVYEITLFVFAPGADYRYSHWLVTVTCIALATLAVARKPAWAIDDDV